MQNAAQALIVVKDQFALKSLSDDALKQIRPVYQNAISRLLDQLKNLPEGSLERELWLRTQLSTLVAQSRAIQDRIMQVLPQSQLQAWDQGLKNAEDYLVAGGIQPGQPAATTMLSGSTTGGQQVSVSGNLPGFNITNATEKGFLSPSITRQQIVASLDAKGFETLLQGKKGAAGRNYSLSAVVERIDLASDVSRQLREGFLLGESSEDIARRISHAFGHVGGRNGGKVWAMTQAVVRTSMAEASQSAHDAFYKANEDLLIPTKSGYKWWWDASNDTRLCQICAPLDGVKFKERNSPPHAWPAHFSCRCKILPWTRTMEIREERDGPASGSFLEATPVQYDKRGKRLPPPAGYTGDNAYKRPMKIDGKQQWVRRRDLGKGQTTAGDMLKAANEHSKKLVLGKHTEAFNRLTGPGGQYEKDPQGAVRKLLGEPLPPGSTAPRPVRGPKPKPPAPKPKAASKTSPGQAVGKSNQEYKKHVGENSFTMPNRRFNGADIADMVNEGALSPGEVGANFRKVQDFVVKDGQVLFVSETEAGLAKRVGAFGVRDLNAKDVPWALSDQYKQLLEKGIGPEVLRDAKFHEGRLPVLLSNEKALKEKIERAKASGWKDEISVNNLKNVRRGIKESKEYLKDMPRRLSSHALASAADGHTASYTRRVVISDDFNELLHGPFDKSAKTRIAAMSQDVADTLGARSKGSLSTKEALDTFDARRTTGRNESVLYTYIHETSHQIYFRAGSPPPPRLKGLAPTGYAEMNNDELFAETFSAYVLNPAALKRFDGALYEWAEVAYKEAMRNAGKPLN